MHRIALTLTLCLFAWFAVGCASGPRYQLKKLPSGKEIKMLSLTTMTYSSGSPAVIFKYQTDLAIDDVAALQAEANEIMGVLKIDAERTNVTRAMVSASNEPKGVVFTQVKSYNFLFEKRPDGTWAPISEPKS